MDSNRLGGRLPRGIMNIYRSLPNLITLRAARPRADRYRDDFGRSLGGGLRDLHRCRISDAIDGWLAKSFSLQTELGAYLDPLADKALLVSIYVALAVFGAVPSWLTILRRRAGYLDYRRVHVFLADEQAGGDPAVVDFQGEYDRPDRFRGGGAWRQGVPIYLGPLFLVCTFAVAALTLTSLAAYLAVWARHMSL